MTISLIFNYYASFLPVASASSLLYLASCPSVFIILLLCSDIVWLSCSIVSVWSSFFPATTTIPRHTITKSPTPAMVHILCPMNINIPVPIRISNPVIPRITIFSLSDFFKAFPFFPEAFALYYIPLIPFCQD